MGCFRDECTAPSRRFAANHYGVFHRRSLSKKGAPSRVAETAVIEGNADRVDYCRESISKWG